MTIGEVTALFTAIFGTGGLTVFIRSAVWPWYKARGERQEKREERLVKAQEDVAVMVRETRQDVGHILTGQARIESTQAQTLERVAALEATQGARQTARVAS